jgi:hypothetical protein
LAQLSITRSGRKEGVFYLPDRPVVIGRSDGVDIQLLDSRVSRRHSVIRQSVAGFMIQDLNTKNGTFVNSEAVEKSLLFHGDTIVLGGYTLHFLEEDGIDELASGDISIIKESGSLTVPTSLADQAPPKSRTNADPGGGPPARANRLDRVRPERPPFPDKPKGPGRSVPPPGRQRPAPRSRTPKRRDSQSITHVPIIEGLAADDLEISREESYSEIEIIIDEDGF